MSVLDGFRAVQMGPGLAAAVCGRLLADVGATVVRIGVDRSSPLAEHLNRGDSTGCGVSDADLIICEGSPATLRRFGHDPDTLRRINPRAALVLISPFGQTGPRAEEPATDLTLFFASGIARMLTGQVDDLDEAPMRPAGDQSAFLGGLAAACAGMHAALMDNGAVVDVSIQEALATLAMTELTRAGQMGERWSRKRVADGNGATVCILPASDGYAAISPREDRQWAAWLVAMGTPAWGRETGFATKADRVANWDALHALMSAWSHDKTRDWIAATAQAAHVPSFPLREPADHLGSAQLRHRNFFHDAMVAGHSVRVPGSPFGIGLTMGDPPVPAARRALPLSGVRVLDFSWVIAGPTATRYLAAMGAEVIKVEAPGRGDPGRASELHSVLGQAKKGIVLDLKNPEAIGIARALAARADVLVENFATGVMDRLGLGANALRAINPGLIYVSASGLGRTGPEAHAVAYGTLLQCYAGFAGLNRQPGVPPRVGMAWLDPMCGLMLGFVTAAALWRRRTGSVARVDFSMIEAMLWTMAGPLLESQLPAADRAADQGAVYRRAGVDEWIAIDPAPAVPPGGDETSATFTAAGIAASASAGSADLVGDAHLRARGFWDDDGLPGLPWRASFGRARGAAPGLGSDTDAVLRDVLGKPVGAIPRLREAGALG
jgi:crotonobetainyl-CoA:carnitine CoA-transferase CaiB-like acyl-CoA transferase